MSWLSSVRKGIQSLTKRQSADNLWHKCKKCGSMASGNFPASRRAA